jgi:hypothetical protein
MSADERIERAGLLYERFVFGGDVGVVACWRQPTGNWTQSRPIWPWPAAGSFMGDSLSSETGTRRSQPGTRTRRAQVAAGNPLPPP